jgi:hypothetical protein
MSSVVWDSEGILLVEFLKRGATVNSQRHVQTVKKSKQRIGRVRAKTHSLATVPIQHPTSSILSDAWRMDGLRGRRFSGQADGCVKNSGASRISFARPAYSVSRRGGECVLLMETLWKNNLSFVKDVPMICVHFITPVIIVSKKKHTRLYFPTDLRNW